MASVYFFTEKLALAEVVSVVRYLVLKNVPSHFYKICWGKGLLLPLAIAEERVIVIILQYFLVTEKCKDFFLVFS